MLEVDLKPKSPRLLLVGMENIKKKKERETEEENYSVPLSYKKMCKMFNTRVTE